MKFCQACGAQIPDGDKFCGECGAVVEEPTASEVIEEKTEALGDAIEDKATEVGEALEGAAAAVTGAVVDAVTGTEASDAPVEAVPEPVDTFAAEAAGVAAAAAAEPVAEAVSEPVEQFNAPAPVATYDNSYSSDYDAPKSKVPGNAAGIAPRNIVVAIILTFVTCGIYGLYWIVKLNNEINQLSGHPEDTSGGMVLLLTIVTCGIYGWYWNFKMGEKVDEIKGDPNGSSKIIFIILAICELSIVNYALMQNTINTAVEG
ncbi:MAG: DUF4234 domain-containing protein [Clostridiales bacterium]|nr:DUF4234 domain-containing protein [Clostridiales bacterium]